MWGQWSRAGLGGHGHASALHPMAPPATEAGEGYGCHRPPQPYLVHASGPGGRQPASRVSPCLAQQDPGDGEASGLGREEARQDGPHALVCLCPAHVQGPRVEQQQDDRAPSGCREMGVKRARTSTAGTASGCPVDGEYPGGVMVPLLVPQPISPPSSLALVPRTPSRTQLPSC